ncbi:MAG: hypothetical protein NT098_05480 [Candidatus Parcubacteria bacterium]|nr:hypothetical protein [Candidatus Parcubacteria bacterium]
MTAIDINNKEKGYLDEKELFVLYWLNRKKYISTCNNLFNPNTKFTFHNPSEPSEIATIEEDINKALSNALQKYQSKRQSPKVLSYLLDTGKEIDEKGFSIFGNADYSLVEGGFLSNYLADTMYEYLDDTEENRKDNEKYGNLNKEQKAFLDTAIKNKDFDSSKFSILANSPIKEYQKAILNKEAEEDFIELVNKLITEYDGGKWTTKDVEKFLEIYYRHNKVAYKKKAVGEGISSLVRKDSQIKLANLIFENADFRLIIQNSKKLEQFLDTYTTSFVDDELNGQSNNGLTKSFYSEGLTISLHTQFFGFKKQKDILVKYIEQKYEEYQRNDLEIGHPHFEPEYIGNHKKDTFQVTLSESDKERDLFLFVHTIIALENEGYLKIDDFSCGSVGIFDLYDRGFLFKIRLNKKTRNKQVQEWGYDKKYQTLKFLGQEIELSKKGKKTDEVFLLETLLTAENDEWKHNDEILNDWGYNDDDLKNLPKNKVYFAGRNINNKIAIKTQIEDFIECNTTKARINPKYKKVDE